MGTDTSKRKIANQLINRVKDFPPLPNFVGRIMQVNADPDSSIEDLSRIVEAEISLTASIIKLANSPFFGLTREVSSIPHALAILGRDELQNMVIASSMFKTFKNLKHKKDVANIWLHSFRCAIAARIVGEKIKHIGSDFFVAGLIHDIGKLLICFSFSENALKKVYRDIFQVERDDLRDEKEMLGIGHDSIGMQLVRSWMFPESLQMAVGYHHKPWKAKEHTVFPLVILVADSLVRIIEIEEEDQEPVSFRQLLIDSQCRQALASVGLKIDAATVEELLGEVKEELAREKEITSMFV